MENGLAHFIVVFGLYLLFLLVRWIGRSIFQGFKDISKSDWDKY